MRHRHEIRVRYGETDQMGVVHHSVYALYFEEARTELMRSLGIRYADMERDGVLLPLIEVAVRFIRGPRYDDVLVLESRVSELSRARVRIDYSIYRKEDGELLAHGHSAHACTNAELRPRRFPEHVDRAFRAALESAGGEDAPRTPV
ncbi:MAG: acyl-CoA thioesterase [Planctomycetota bacterium]|jgi:acyl-CoA thioester hydrolase